MPWKSRPVILTKQQRADLKKIAASKTETEKVRMRSIIVLLLGEGLKNKEIAKRLGIHENTVVKWRGRWTGDNQSAKVVDYGELTGRPRHVLLPDLLAQMKKAANGKPPAGSSRWTVRKMAAKFNLPLATTQRALRELGIKFS